MAGRRACGVGMHVTLTAQCSNCASWRLSATVGGHLSTEGAGYCAKGLFPDEGQLLCQRYEASARFKQEIVSAMLKEQGPMAMPVRLVGGRKSARAYNKKQRR